MPKWKTQVAGGLLAAAALVAVHVMGDASATQRVVVQTSYVGKVPVAKPGGLPLGVYDPFGDFQDHRDVSIEHVFLPWEDVDLSTLFAAEGYAKERNRTLLVTVEPWNWTKEWRLTYRQLLESVLSGGEDARIDAVCSVIGELRTPVQVRWAHEMEDRSGRYSWSNWPPRLYADAYRRFVTRCRAKAPQAKFMWSPKGDRALTAYYPGDDVVDVIGVSLFALQQLDLDQLARNRTFVEMMTERYERVAPFGKPIVVAELGYVGDQAYVTTWANDVSAAYPQFPLLTAVVYFDHKEVHPWPDGYGLPDWRVIASAVTNR
jgi:beta-mannanase